MTVPLQDLLFKAAFLPDGRGLAAWQTWRAWVDLDGFLDPGSYRLLPQLYRNVQKRGVDDPLILKLKGVARLNWSKNQLTFHRLEEINGLLRQAGIGPIVLGGVGQALSGQADTPLDPPYYYDLLVRREDAMAAVRELQKMGWRPVEGWRAPAEAREYERRGSCLFHDLQGSQVHLFWGLFGQQAELEHWETGLWERARIFDWNGDTFRVLGPEDQLLYIAGQKVTREGSDVFLQAIDVMLVLQTCAERLDGGKLCTLVQGLGLTQPLQHILGYIRNTLGDDWRAEGLVYMPELPNSTIERLANRLNFHRLVSWEDFPSEWWVYFRENRRAPRVKKFAGFARLMGKKWQWRYMWQVPILGVAWMGRKVLYGTS